VPPVDYLWRRPFSAASTRFLFDYETFGHVILL
jgi:hypothetical protein